MPEPFSFGGIEVRLASRGADEDARPDAEEPFRVLLIGDFGGRASRGAPAEPGEVASRRPLHVDRDNLDEVMRRLGVRLRLELGGRPHDLYFDAVDDFHPDRLYERLDIFRPLKQVRRKLQDSSTFEEAAAEVRRWTSTREADAATTPAEPLPPPASTPARTSGVAADEAAGLSSSDLIAQMLDAQAASPGGDASSKSGAGLSSEPSDFARFLRELVGPHLVADKGAEEEELTRVVDEAVGGSMRAVLHHADFQSLEAAWRGVRFLAHGLDTGPHLKLYLLDLTRDELETDLRSSDDLTRTALYRLLVEQTVGTRGGEPWALLAGLHTFDATRADAELLGRLAKIARAAGAPFVSSASPRLVGCPGPLAESPDPDDWRDAPVGPDAEAWRALRRLPEAGHLGLLLPRFLLRLPYGAETDPADTFDFEETPEGDEPPHESYLWGNPALVCARLLAEGFGRDGWNLRPGDVLNVTDLPLHVYRAAGETRTKPCAEVLLGERAARAMLEHGLMPLLSFKDRDELRLARFQSLSDPPTRLAGRWN